MYEYDQYVEAIKTLPKRKRKVQTPMGEGRVVQILPLRQSVIVDLPEIGPRQFTKEELDRAEKIARGEKVEPLPDDSDVGDLNKDITKPAHGHGRGRQSRRSRDN
jgi:hypothetical protein